MSTLNVKNAAKKAVKKFLTPTAKSFTPKRLKTSIRFDPMNPTDYLKYDFRFACEDCSHFDSEKERCTLGYQASWHRKEFQKKSYELTGKMALCRFLEID